METMKRAISFFMALVLVLGMVPGTALRAAAEELETQPETVTEETAEAPAETEAEEPIPAETEAETEAETVPEETVFEETVEETDLCQENIPVQEAANAAAEPTEIVLKASKERTYVGDEVQLSVAVLPENAKQDAYELSIVDGDAILDEDGLLTAQEPGKVKIQAVSTKDAEIKATVEVTFVAVRIAFNLLPIDEEYLWDQDEDEEMDSIRLSSGQKLEVSLKYQTNETGEDEDWVTEYLLTPDVEWKIIPTASEAFAALTVDSENESIAILKAENVTEAKYFTLYAKDAIAGEAEVLVKIRPNPAGLEILDEEDNSVSGKTITIDLGKYNREEYQFLLKAAVIPLDATQKIRWETSSDMIAGVEPVGASDEEPAVFGGEEEEEEPDGTQVIVSVGGERLEGEATLTAICVEDPSIKATFTIKTVDHLQAHELVWHSSSAELEYLVAGDSFKLKALDKTDPENKVVLTSEQVEWSLPTEDKAYASITQDGVLTARNVASGKRITVYCRVIGNEEACLELSVKILPKAQYVTLLDENGAECNGKTICVNTAGEIEDFFLDYRVEPFGNDYAETGSVALLSAGYELGALQKVTWTSSNTAIAKIAKDGKITWKGKDGTVTITATAADGSGKSASVKLKFGKFAESVEIKCPVEYLRSGESVTMSRTTDVSGAKLTWSLADGDEKYASISSSGKLTIKTIYEQREITVIAVAEGTGASAEIAVLIKPAKNNILTLYSDGKCVTKTTQQLDKATETIVLTAYIVGEDSPEDVKWSYPSSVEKIFDDGNGTAEFAMKKTETATIKATSRASGKTATVTVKGIRKTVDMYIVEKEEMQLSAGQSMTLKAKLFDAEGKTPSSTSVRWSVTGEGADYASISSGGKLTVNSGFRGNATTVTVVARAADGSGVKATCEVTIRPKATGVMIQRGGINRVSMTHKIENADDVKFRLTAEVYPLNQANANVKWTTSNSKIATVSANGGITCVGTGTVTIKATAQDGSGKYASLKLTITKPVSEISFEDNRSIIAGGKSLTLKPAVLAADGKKPTSSAITWSISGDTAYVSSFKNGVLKTKKVTERKVVTVTATAQDGSGVSTSFDVKIYPATTSVHILDDYGNKAGTKTMYMRVGETLDLEAISYPNNDDSKAAQVWTWSSSSKTYATVDSDGVVTAKKAGTVTIKATAKDGTGKYGSVKIKILK